MIGAVTRTTGEGTFDFDHRDMMVFILIMSLTGLQNAFTEIMPELEVGPLELGVGGFVFVPIVLVLLFRTFWAALAVPVGEIVFGEILLGEFDGLGAMEGLLLITASYYFAARLLEDPNDTKQLAVVVFVAEGLEEFLATFVDVGKVWVGVENLEAVPGLPESILVIEGVDFLVQMAITGVVFGVIPALYLYPKLHGKVEPLLGMDPIESRPDERMLDAGAIKALVVAVLVFPLALGFEALSEAGGAINVIWEPEFLETVGQTYIAVPILVSLAVAGIVLYLARRRTAGTGN